MILEGIVTTMNSDDTTNVSPMGPLVDGPDFTTFVLRPYQTSTTYQNLKRTQAGVLHVTDDVELIALAAIGQLDQVPATREANAVEGRILTDACRWLAFRVSELDDSEERTTIQCEVVDRGNQREFFGLCRAKHAVVEAAILATRTEFLPHETIRADFERLAIIVKKTAGEAEQRAFDRLTQYVEGIFNS